MGTKEASVLGMIVNIHEEFCELFRMTYFSDAVAAAKKIDKVYKKNETLSEDEDCTGLIEDANKILFLLYDSNIKQIRNRERSTIERKNVAEQLTEQLRMILSGMRDFAAAEAVDLGKVIEYRHALQGFLKELRRENLPIECSINDAFDHFMGAKKGHAKPAKENFGAIPKPVRSMSEGYGLGNSQGFVQSSKAKDKASTQESIEISDSGTESEGCVPSASRQKTTKTTKKATGKAPVQGRQIQRSQTYDGTSGVNGQHLKKKSRLSSEVVPEEEEEEGEIPISSGQHNPPPPPYTPPQRVNNTSYAPQHQTSLPTNPSHMGYVPSQANGVPYRQAWIGTHVPGHGSGFISAPPAPIDPHQVDPYQSHPNRVMSAPPDTLQFHPAALQVFPWLASTQNQPGSQITLTDCFNVKNETVGTRKPNRRATDAA